MNLFSNTLVLIFLLCSFYSVSPVKDKKLAPEHSGAKKARSCYFSTPNKGSVTSYGTLNVFSLSSLANNKDGHFFGAPHEMGITVARFEGIYLDERSDISQWKDKMICTNHLNELSRDFNNSIYKHRTFHQYRLQCGFPEISHTSPAVRGLELTYQQSKYLLENRHFLLLPGTPLCTRHHEELIGMEAGHAAESKLDLKKIKDTGTEGEVEDMVTDDVEEDPEGVCVAEGEDDPDYKARITPSSLRSFFHQFAAEAGVTRVTCSKSWAKITNRAKNYRVHGIAELVEIQLSLLADTPEGQSELKKRLIDVLQGKSPFLEETFVADQMLTVMAEQYKKATNTQGRVFTLAPFTQLFDYPTVAQYIEGLSHRVWQQAVRLSIDHESLIPPELRIVDRICPVKLAFYIYFLTRGQCRRS